MYAILWQITARYLRIEAERLNFSTRRYSDLKKKKEGRKREKKRIERGHRYFSHFCKVNNYCKKDKKNILDENEKYI